MTLLEIIKTLKVKLLSAEKRCEQYQAACEHLQHELNELRRYRFGKRSEKQCDGPDGLQGSLFDDDGFKGLSNPPASPDPIVPEPQTPIDPKASDDSPPPKNKQKRTKKEPDRRIEIIPLSEEQKHCSCCGKLKSVIRYETKELLNYQPAVFEIIEQRREVATCSNGCDGQMATAPTPKHVLPKAKVTEAFLAFLIVSKFEDRQPLYHLEKQCESRHGITCSRQSMARWLIELVPAIQPLYNLLQDRVIDYDVAACDATTLQVLKEPDRRAETKSYLYCMRGGPPEEGVVLYAYNDKKHKQFVQTWFEGFEGYLHVDGDNIFEEIGEGVLLVNCNAHARRKFEPIAKSAKKAGLAQEVLRFYKALYAIEKKAKKDELTPDQRYELRQKKAKPLFKRFEAWLETNYPFILPESHLGKAFNYCNNRLAGLMRYLEDGRLEIDNNGTEREIKPAVIARKNFLFAASVLGAKAIAMHFSIIRTAKLHGLDPYHYYTYIFKELPFCKTVEDYEKLLPWNYKIACQKAS